MRLAGGEGSPGAALLEEVADSANVLEGPEGVRRVLRAVFQAGALPIRDLSREAGLPVPVVAAIRGELESRGILLRKGGVALSEVGCQIVRQHLGISCRRKFPSPQAPPIPTELKAVQEQLEEVCKNRPQVDVRLDQSHATAETTLRRAIFLYGHDALEGRNVLILGDDDLTSLGVIFLAKFLGFRTQRIVVVELDERLVEFLLCAGSPFDGSVEVIQHDLRLDLPRNLTGRFDTFFTDPPYTLEGLDLFVSRGASGLRPRAGGQGFVSFGHRSPDETARAIGAILEMGLSPIEILPGFNRYVGAQVLAGVSQMIRAVSTERLRPRIQGAYTGALYTADRKRAQKAHGR